MPRPPPTGPDAWGLRGARTPLVALTELVVTAIALRGWALAGVCSPQVLCDEFIHSEIARGLLDDGWFTFRGAEIRPPSILSPALIAPAWLIGSTVAAYSAIKLINVAPTSLVAVPVYLWTRRVAGPWAGLAAATLSLTLPGLAYAGLVMTEPAFLPALALATFAMADALERPSGRSQVLALAAIAGGALIRPQALVLVPALVAALAMCAGLEARAAPRDARRSTAHAYLGRFRPLLAAVAGTILVLALRVPGGTSSAALLGPYRDVTRGAHDAGAVRDALRDHTAELALPVAFVPLTALLLLNFGVLRSRDTSAAERAFISVAIAATAATPSRPRHSPRGTRPGSSWSGTRSTPAPS